MTNQSPLSTINPGKLMLIRKLFFMTMSEAAEVMCLVKPRSYHQYETGVVGIPAAVADRVLTAIEFHKYKVEVLESQVTKGLARGEAKVMLMESSLEDWLVARNPTHSEVSACKLDWYIDVAVRAALALKYDLAVVPVTLPENSVKH